MLLRRVKCGLQSLQRAGVLVPRAAVPPAQRAWPLTALARPSSDEGLDASAIEEAQVDVAVASTAPLLEAAVGGRTVEAAAPAVDVAAESAVDVAAESAVDVAAETAVDVAAESAVDVAADPPLGGSSPQEAHPRTDEQSLERLRRQAPPVCVLYQDEGDTRIPDQVLGSHVWGVLLRLRLAGHDAYIVGGALRDVLLGKTPKDIDILTTAAPQRVCKLFRQARCVGRAFPICHVPAGDRVLEVSSFSTSLAPGSPPLPPDTAERLRTSPGAPGSAKQRGSRRRAKAAREAGEAEEAKASAPSATLSWADARRSNALQRDFTVNALMYDPFRYAQAPGCG